LYVSNTSPDSFCAPPKIDMSLPVSRSIILEPPNASQTLKIAIRLKAIVDCAVPVAIEQKYVDAADSPIVTNVLVRKCFEACGGTTEQSKRKFEGCVVFALLTVTRWYNDLADDELYDSTLYGQRAECAQRLAVKIIDGCTDERYLFLVMLAKRYTINLNGIVSTPFNALEMAIDQHSTIVISCSGFQRCIKWMWRGWIIQSGENPNEYILYNHTDCPKFWTHFNPERVKTPEYQNLLQLIVSLLYVVAYTWALNDGGERPLRRWRTGEVVFYTMTLSFILDEATKLFHVGLRYLSFWNVFNNSLYFIVSVSFLIKIFGGKEEPLLVANQLLSRALSRDIDIIPFVSNNRTSYRLLACCAPFVWSRLLLFLDTKRFFGIMLVVLEELMKESIVFFVLLAIVLAGFLQAFLGLDLSDGRADSINMVVNVLIQTVLASPVFDSFENFAPPYAMVLYYICTFVISTLLLNILIALFNTAYQHVCDNGSDEFLALTAKKTLWFIRAPDENVFVPPLNIIEVIVTPLSLVLSRESYQSLCDSIMYVIYFPVLIGIGVHESKMARRVAYNRLRHAPDDANEDDCQWDLSDGYDDGDEDAIASRAQVVNELADTPDFKIEGFSSEKEWLKSLKVLNPYQVETEQVGVRWELKPLINKIDTLTELVEKLTNKVDEQDAMLKKKTDSK
jgi:hypothetical protein